MLGKRTGFRAVMQLDIPVKRQKVTETERLTFDLLFPSFDVKPLADCRQFALDISIDRVLSGKLTYPVLAELEMRP